MSIRTRSILGAVALFGGLLLLAGAGVYKSSVRIKYDQEVQRGRADPGQAPSPAVPNILMVLGALGSVAGLAVIVMATRDMVAEIQTVSTQAERRLQDELLNSSAPKPKPKP